MLNQEADLDRLFNALADPARGGMVERLSRGPASVSELAKPLPMSLPSAMQHLGVLEDAGLVRSEKVGRVQMSGRTGRTQPRRAMDQRPAKRMGTSPRPHRRLSRERAQRGV